MGCITFWQNCHSGHLCPIIMSQVPRFIFSKCRHQVLSYKMCSAFKVSSCSRVMDQIFTSTQLPCLCVHKTLTFWIKCLIFQYVVALSQHWFCLPMQQAAFFIVMRKSPLDESPLWLVAS